MRVRGELGPFFLVLTGLVVACSGKVASDNTGNGSSSGSSGSSGSTSSGGVVSSSSGGNSGSDSGGGGNSGSTSGSGGTSSGSGGTGSSGGSSSSGGTGSSSGTSSGGNDQCAQLPPLACNEPPTPPSGPVSGISAAHDYAIRTFYLGDTDRAGNPNPNAWTAFGYDLDGRITTSASTDVCTLVQGASRQVQIDGNGGIDNSWGSNIVPIMETLNSNFSAQVNMAIQGGGPTQLFYVTGFDDSAGSTTTATGLAGLTLATVQFTANGGVPTWNTSTHWPIAPEFINGCSLSTGCPPGTDPIQQAQTRFPSAFQLAGTFASGAPVDLALQIDVNGQPMTLTVHQAVVTFSPLAPGAVTNGTIAGVLDTSELIAQLKQVAGRISTSLCSGSAFQSIASQIEQTSDIVLNGSTVSNSAGVVCNAISIGIGFDATEIAVPVPADVAGPQPTPPDPCGDGG